MGYNFNEPYDPEGNGGMEAVHEMHRKDQYQALIVKLEHRLLKLQNENERLMIELDYWHSRYAEDQGG
jgi:hypothetical protein